MTRRQAALIGTIVVLAGLGAACGGTNEDAAKTPDATKSTKPASTVPDTTAVTTGEICTTPKAAAMAIVAAWGMNDLPAARRCAAAAVTDRLFQASGVGNGWTFQGCDATDPGVPVCAYSYKGGGAFLTMEGTEAVGWKATKLAYIAS